LFVVDRGKAAHLAEVVAGQFPDLPREFLDGAVAEITRAGSGRRAPSPTEGSAPAPARTRPAPASPFAALAEPGDWPYSRDSMVKAILASASPGRDDRLFPGDVAQFTDGGGLGLAYGAAGVLYALAATGAERYEEGERWLLDHTDPLPPGTPLGLYDGVAGVAYVLDRLGHRQRALDLVDQVLHEKWQKLSSDLRGGLAGLGLVLDHLGRATGETSLDERAAEAAELLVRRLGEPRPAPPKRRAGLLRGASGPALFLLRRYEATGDRALLEAAGEALRQDLEACVLQQDGALAVDEGWRTMPYLADGSVGLGMVIDDFLAHTDGNGAARGENDAAWGENDAAWGADLAGARNSILTAATYRFYAQPGLFQGRAGMVLYLGRTGAPRPRLDEQIAGLGWYAMPYQGQLAFPGHHMMRLSMDLATGTAGCLLALGATLADEPTAHLPFLPALPPQQPGRPQGRGSAS
jgi:hypothetical protein